MGIRFDVCLRRVASQGFADLIQTLAADAMQQRRADLAWPRLPYFCCHKSTKKPINSDEIRETKELGKPRPRGPMVPRGKKEAFQQGRHTDFGITNLYGIRIC